MAGLRKHDMSTTFPTLSNQMRRMFDARRWPFDDFLDEPFFDEEWSPAVDVKEEAKSYVVQADIPGVDPKDIDVTLENGILSIRGHREEERKEERENYHRIERFRGSFSRRFTLPEAAGADAVDASVDKGVLVVRIPKSEKAVSRKITIKS